MLDCPLWIISTGSIKGADATVAFQYLLPESASGVSLPESGRWSLSTHSPVSEASVAVDLTKRVFKTAIADDKRNVVEQQRLIRSQFERWFHNREVGLVVM